MQRLERHAELEQWSVRAKLLLLDLSLKRRAEHLFEVLSEDSKVSFQAAADSLRKRLAPVRWETLVLAQFMKQKQRL